MVSTAEGRETPKLHGPMVKFRNDTDMVLQNEKYLKVVLSRLGWSRHPSNLTVEDVCKVGQPAASNQASITDTAVLVACWTFTCQYPSKNLLPKDVVWCNFT